MICATKRGIRRQARRLSPEYAGSDRTLQAFLSLVEKSGRPARLRTRASSTAGHKIAATKSFLPHGRTSWLFHHATKKATAGRIAILEIG